MAIRRPYRIGLIGCGQISHEYLSSCTKGDLDARIVACSDLDASRADAAADTFSIVATSADRILADSEIDIVLNLTVPSAHASVSRSAILADKHVYSEKPMAIDFTEASALSALAKEHHVILACAPDTILGSAHKTARDLLDAGTLGMPFAAVAFLAKRGPERWHPNPDFFYQEGAGPLLDMGPYYMASLISLLGPVATVMGCTLSPQPYRVAGEDLESGRRFLSQVPTTSIGCLRFESGVATTLMFSFDVWGAGLPRIEIYCTKGTIRLPDPNDFEGEVIYRKAPEDGWKTADPSSTARQESRGAGLQEMARALSRGRKPAMDSEFALHAIDVLDLLRQCTPEGTIARTRSTCHRPAQGDAG